MGKGLVGLLALGGLAYLLTRKKAADDGSDWVDNLKIGDRIENDKYPSKIYKLDAYFPGGGTDTFPARWVAYEVVDGSSMMLYISALKDATFGWHLVV
jgi:hypothetical protein